jgi:hypothetical protein
MSQKMAQSEFLPLMHRLFVVGSFYCLKLYEEIQTTIKDDSERGSTTSN